MASNPVLSLMSKLLENQLNISASDCDQLYLLQRALYFQSHGLCNHSFNYLIGLNRPIEHPSIANDLRSIVLNLQDYGYYHTSLSHSSRSDIPELLSVLDTAHSDEFRRKSISDFRQLSKIPSITRLVQQNHLKIIADHYLGCNSFLNYIELMQTSGSSTARDLNSLSRQAMLFHRDADHNKFLKFFVYLNDVDIDDGPHQYVRASHHSPSPNTNIQNLFEDRRYRNLELVNQNLEIITCTGPAGTLLIGDTHCFHKGSPPRPGHSRSILILQFTDSLLGPAHALNPPSYVREVNSLISNR